MTISAQPATLAEEATRTTLQIVRAIVAQVADLPSHQVTAQTDWRFYDANQMDMGRITFMINEQLKVRLTLKEVYREANLGKLADYIDTMRTS